MWGRKLPTARDESQFRTPTFVVPPVQGYNDYAKNVASVFQDLKDGCPSLGRRKSSIGSGSGSAAGGFFGSGGMGVYM